MKILDKTPNRNYEIIITTDFSLLVDKMKSILKPSSLVIITDSNVEKLYLEEVKELLAEVAPIYIHSIKAGEASKNLETITQIYDTLVHNQVDRSSAIVALGGGVVGDIAGFVASSYMRGIPFIQIPTTIVAQNDSSIGGKVGVDYLSHKNMVGAFYQPLMVYTNVSTLATLNLRELVSGLAEVIKHALIKSLDFYDYLSSHKDKILKQDIETLVEMTYYSCQIKSQVVEEDVHEMGIRKILNFGHTLGHALETLSQFKILHGECVGYGMCMAAYVSFKRQLISKDEFENILDICKAYGLLTPIKKYSIEDILAQMNYDKKKLHGKISFILLKHIGQPEIVRDITDEEIREAVLFIQEACS